MLGRTGHRWVMRLLGIGLVVIAPLGAGAGTITQTVVDDKGSITIPNGHFETVFGSRMSADLGPEWGDLAGHHERKNSEKLVWVNDGPPIVLHFANVFPKEIHVPQTPAPNPHATGSFFDIFTEIKLNGLLGPLEDGMQIEEGPDTFLEGASGTKYFGKVTPITDLALLPTSNANDTQIVWDLSQFEETTGNFYLIEYELAPIDLVPEPSTLALFGIAIAALIGFHASARPRRVFLTSHAAVIDGQRSHDFVHVDCLRLQARRFP